jgi:hypothetical protein
VFVFVFPFVVVFVFVRACVNEALIILTITCS